MVKKISGSVWSKNSLISIIPIGLYRKALPGAAVHIPLHMCVPLHMWVVTVTLCIPNVLSATACGWHRFTSCWGQLWLYSFALCAPNLSKLRMLTSPAADPTSLSAGWLLEFRCLKSIQT